MKSTLLFICSLLCLAFFSWQLVVTGDPLPPDPEAFEQVVNPREAEALLLSQQAFNSGVGLLNLWLSVVALAAAITSIFFLRKPRILRWFRGGLLTANIIVLMSCLSLFLLTLLESMQPDPQCLQLVHPWKVAFWTQALKHVQQAGMFLSLCCGMLSGVNCTAFYLFHRRRQIYGD